MISEETSLVDRLARHAGMPRIGAPDDDLSTLLYECGKVRFVRVDVVRLQTITATVVSDIMELNRIYRPRRINVAGRDRKIAEQIPYFLSGIVLSLVVAFGVAQENDAPMVVREELFNSLKRISYCVDCFFAGDIEDLKADLDAWSQF